jgi:predicted Zn-dependent protease
LRQLIFKHDVMTPRTLKWLHCALTVAALIVLSPASQAQPRDFMPDSDNQVLETLPPRVRASTSTSTPESAAIAARRAIELARETADPRYLGRAQAALGRWWDSADAPAPLAILQATVQQSRHEFGAARATLQRALARDAAQPQGWLTLATLERLAGRYPAALAACAQVARGGAALHAAACEYETRSLQGHYEEARRGLLALRRQAPDAATQAWLLSLLAESEERAGLPVQARRSYQDSLALSADGYTSLAYADLLLRSNEADAALKVLADQPASDAVLLRQARAMRQRADPRWQPMAADVAQRLAALNARGDDPAWHAREQAMAALWLQDDAPLAWQAAQLDLQHQKEPVDWLLAFEAAERARDRTGLARLREELAATGLRDERLAPWLTGGRR